MKLLPVIAAAAALAVSMGAQAAPGPFVKQAFDLLMDRYVVPPTSTTLLTGGWTGGLDFLKTATGSEQSIGAPAFSGDRNADWTAFLGAYPQLTAAGGSSLDQHGLDYAIVSGMAKSLNSTHTFLQPSQPQANQSFVGIGVQISTDLVITEVYPGTPAEAAGVRPGDRLIAVDGTSVEGMKSDDVTPRVRGPPRSYRGAPPEQGPTMLRRGRPSPPRLPRRGRTCGRGGWRCPTAPRTPGR